MMMMMQDEPLVDARGMFVVHTMFRREFGQMPGLVRAVTAGDSTRTALVADHVALVTQALAAHHKGEDHHIWPRLRERCPTECTSLVDVMEDQHQAIHERCATVDNTAASWRDTASADTRYALAEAIGQLLMVTGAHLALEEERVVPLIEKYLTEAEYAMVAQESAAALPPDKLIIVLGMTIYEGDPEVIDTIVSHMPPEVQPVIKDMASNAYAAYAEKLYRTATPPRETD
jgi:hemerythrin-like domain-containing protein